MSHKYAYFIALEGNDKLELDALAAALTDAGRDTYCRLLRLALANRRKPQSPAIRLGPRLYGYSLLVRIRLTDYSPLLLERNFHWLPLRSDSDADPDPETGADNEPPVHYVRLCLGPDEGTDDEIEYLLRSPVAWSLLRMTNDEMSSMLTALPAA